VNDLKPSNIPKEKLVEMYEGILKIRRFEEKVWDLFGQNKVPGTIHLYLGEEAVAVGVCSALRGKDYVVSTHRGHGHCIAKGAQLDKMMAELLGKKTGYCRGKGGSMHVTDAKVNLLGATGVVGSGLPLAVGAALAVKLQKTDQVVVCFFGDGASNQGTFHESLNLAAAWKLPVLFICENNLYAMGTRISTVTAVGDIATRAKGYGIAGEVADGNDVLNVYDVAVKATERTRAGEGPTLIECKTYRMKGHSRFDPAKYRPQEEFERWMKRDPIETMKKRLVDETVLTEKEVAAVDEKVKASVERAATFALESSYPEVEEALRDVYAGEGSSS